MNLRNLIVVALAALLLGCGGRGEPRVHTVPVNGKLYVDDKAFGPALLQLSPEPPDAAFPVVNGYVKPDGTFQLQTYKEGDGAPVGKYKVVLSADPMAAGPVPAVKTLIVEVAQPSGSSAVQLDVKLESSGGEMVSPLPPPGQEGGRHNDPAALTPGGTP